MKNLFFLCFCLVTPNLSQAYPIAVCKLMVKGLEGYKPFAFDLTSKEVFEGNWNAKTRFRPVKESYSVDVYKGLRTYEFATNDPVTSGSTWMSATLYYDGNNKGPFEATFSPPEGSESWLAECNEVNSRELNLKAE